MGQADDQSRLTRLSFSVLTFHIAESFRKYSEGKAI
jgi:hypothetical protein